MEQTWTGGRVAIVRAPGSLAVAVIAVLLMQAMVMFGPPVAGPWVHDRFHSYRHSIGMGCH